MDGFASRLGFLFDEGGGGEVFMAVVGAAVGAVGVVVVVSDVVVIIIIIIIRSPFTTVPSSRKIAVRLCCVRIDSSELRSLLLSVSSFDDGCSGNFGFCPVACCAAAHVA